MNAKDIAARKFDRGFNGYRPDDVDDFLKEISQDFAQLQKENRDLEKKLEVLADKVREYRNDEEALKEALLGAQKQGHAAIAEAKEKVKKLLEDAKEKAEKTVKDANQFSDKLHSEAEENLKNARDESKRMLDETNAKVAKIEEDLRIKTEIKKEVLFKTKNEVTRFRQKLMEDFKRVTNIIEALPESCENEFITRTLEEYKKERNVTLKKHNSQSYESQPVKHMQTAGDSGKRPASNINTEKNDESNDGDALYEKFTAHIRDEKKSSYDTQSENKLFSDLTTEIQFEDVFEEESNDVNTNEDFPVPDSGNDGENEKEEGMETKEPDNLFFKKGENTSKYRGNLDFGSNKHSEKK